MTDYSDEEIEAVQAVVDRVASYQETAPEGTVVEALREGFGEAGVEVSSTDTDKIAEAIEADGSIPVGDLLGSS